MLIFGFGFIFLMTSLGAALVLFFRKISQKTNAILFAFASGVMIAASVWSLLLPSIEQAGVEWGKFALVPVLVGFIVGGTIFVFFDFLSRKINRVEQAETGKSLSISRIRRLFLSVTLHNIPEGLAVGFAFGAAAVQGTAAAYASALRRSLCRYGATMGEEKRFCSVYSAARPSLVLPYSDILRRRNSLSYSHGFCLLRQGQCYLWSQTT